jgi:cytochrome b involved in lipid metabolism
MEAPPPPAPPLPTADLAAAVEARLRAAGRLRHVTRAELARHAAPDDAWIAVGGRVYDISRHVAEKSRSGGATSTLLAILRTAGTDCTAEFGEVHSARAAAQLQPYMVGVLVGGGGGAGGEGKGAAEPEPLVGGAAASSLGRDGNRGVD